MENQTTYWNKDEWRSIQILYVANTIATRYKMNGTTERNMNNGRKSLKFDLIKSNKMMIILKFYRTPSTRLQISSFFLLTTFPNRLRTFFYSQNVENLAKTIFITIYCNCNLNRMDEIIFMRWNYKLCVAKQRRRECEWERGERESAKYFKSLKFNWNWNVLLLSVGLFQNQSKCSKLCIVNQIKTCCL